MARYRIGLDLGGTKIEAIALLPSGEFASRRRIPTPASYEATLDALCDLVRTLERQLGAPGAVGVGIPGTISPRSGLVKNANSTMLNGRALDRDIARQLDREVRVENDANCFALSEAADGAGTGAGVVFGVILGTGCGGGLVVQGGLLGGRQRIAGEWGHNPLPWSRAGAEHDEVPGPLCWCGRHGCLETFVSGPALARDCDGPSAKDASELPARAAAGDARARAALDRHADRLARGLAHVINLLDPDCIVLGGGLSNIDALYETVPALLPRYVFSDTCDTPLLRNRHGDSSGVRGAARLWPAS